MFVTPVLLSGGSGTRLWPLSRESNPKHSLALFGENSLLKATVLRLRSLGANGIQVGSPVIVCNREQQFMVEQQIGDCVNDSTIILEPESRNTAPALGLAANYIRLRQVEDSTMLILPVDQLIRDEDRFGEAVREAVELAAHGYLVTFGVLPTSANTGFGYIERGESLGRTASTVSRFVEKPDANLAQQLVATGGYLWNAGMFVGLASVWVEAMKRNCPAIGTACEEAIQRGSIDGRFFSPSSEAFAKSPADSIDYAVLEPAVGLKEHQDTPVSVIPLDAGWSDVGTWASVWDESSKDFLGNVAVGSVYAVDTKNSFLMSTKRVLAVVGLEDIVVVETGDAVLISHMSATQRVKDIVEKLRVDGWQEAVSHTRVERPWGSFVVTDEGDGFASKRLIVNPGAALSLQLHNHRSEHWVVVNGIASVTLGDQHLELSPRESIDIPVGILHRLANNQPDKVLEVVEVQSGDYLSEDDIERFEDRYHRA